MYGYSNPTKRRKPRRRTSRLTAKQAHALLRMIARKRPRRRGPSGKNVWKNPLHGYAPLFMHDNPRGELSRFIPRRAKSSGKRKRGQWKRGRAIPRNRLGQFTSHGRARAAFMRSHHYDNPWMAYDNPRKTKKRRAAPKGRGHAVRPTHRKSAKRVAAAKRRSRDIHGHFLPKGARGAPSLRASRKAVRALPMPTIIEGYAPTVAMPRGAMKKLHGWR